MKGRGARPLRGLLSGLTTREERLAAIANSSKPNCLIVDLVGITGLGDCASTAMIDAEDEVNVEEFLHLAQEEIEAERERIRAERAEAERLARERAAKRAKADAEVAYTTHEIGSGGFQPTYISEKHWKFIESLGMTFTGWEPNRTQARQITDMLLDGCEPEQVADYLGLEESEWRRVGATPGQIGLINNLRLPVCHATSKRKASKLIIARKKPQGIASAFRKDLADAKTDERVTALARDLAMVKGILPRALWDQVKREGSAKRAEISEEMEY